ncbi:polyprenyl diphosphate synthase [Candidatus Proelusimicrobium volucris]|uniref:polyprenyl diphosphate synthase n=1 Tax=Candidatus Proelusimicrobium volucris TaxID=3416225 RepID=UPI003D0FE8C3
MAEKKNIPTHIAFIMDGNGRWAQNKNLPKAKGHEEGARSVQAVVNAALKTGVKYITLYAFSTENWKRSKTEISALMKLLSKTLDKFIKEDDPKVKIIFSGRREPLPQDILAKMDKAAQIKKDNPALVLNLAINYGARQEITDAVNKLIDSGKKEITQQEISDALYNNLPEPDLIVRTSGEQRLSNFLLWQAAYSEFYFTPVLWPDFKEEHFIQAVEEYGRRQRRFGGR